MKNALTLIVVASVLVLAGQGIASESTGFFRVDYDGSTIGWYNHEQGIIDAEVLVSTDGWVNGAIGFALKSGNFSCYPMLGVEFTPKPIVVEAYLGQIMLFYENERFEVGSWNQYFLGNPVSRFYFRDYASYKVPHSKFALGSQIEGTMYRGDHGALMENDIAHTKNVLAGVRITCDLKAGQLITFVGQNIDRRNESLFRLSFRTFF